MLKCEASFLDFPIHQYIIQKSIFKFLPHSRTMNASKLSCLKRKENVFIIALNGSFLSLITQKKLNIDLNVLLIT